MATKMTDIMTGIVTGISNRLECNVVSARIDGMRIAELFSNCIGQSVHFDELDGLICSNKMI